MLDAGTVKGTFVSVLAGKKLTLGAAKKCNPLISALPTLEKTVKRELSSAKRSDAEARLFRAARLNMAVSTERKPLLEAQQWEAVLARNEGIREGSPICGFDMGDSRSWSAAVLLWPSGRMDAFAACGGIPSLAEREKKDSCPRGLYQQLHEAGRLLVDEGKRFASPSLLLDRVFEYSPCVIISDRFLLAAVEDAIAGRAPLEPRKTRWSESTDDISAFRKLAIDGNLNVGEASRKLMSLGIRWAVTDTDDQGSVRLVKQSGSRRRDDVGVAAVLAAGASSRAPSSPVTLRWA